MYAAALSRVRGLPLMGRAECWADVHDSQAFHVALDNRGDAGAYGPGGRTCAGRRGAPGGIDVSVQAADAMPTSAFIGASTSGALRS